MLEGLRTSVANGLDIMMERLSLEPRRPWRQRVPYSPRTVAGPIITPDTAIQLASVWACLRFLSQTTAILPWHVMREGKDGGELQRTHPIDWLLWKRPNPEWSSFQFRETLVHWALRWGNGYAEIERDQLGRPCALWPIHPERVLVTRDVDTGLLVYEVSNSDTASSSLARIPIPAADMFHLRGFGEGPVGVNVIHYAAQSLGWAAAVQLFGSTFFGNGMNVAGVVINKKPIGTDALKLQKAEFEGIYKGPTRANKTAFIDNDADWKAIGINPEKAQMIDTNSYLVEEICRWFGVPPHKVQHLDDATFSNIESQAVEVVVDSVSPWVKRLEDEGDYKLFGQNRQGFYTKMNLNGLLRGDVVSRGAWYQMMRQSGCYSVNDILRKEDENTIGPDGDKHTMQSQYTTLARIGELPPAAPAAPKAKGGLFGDDDAEDDSAADANADSETVDDNDPEGDAALVIADRIMGEVSNVTHA